VDEFNVFGSFLDDVPEAEHVYALEAPVGAEDDILSEDEDEAEAEAEEESESESESESEPEPEPASRG